MVRSSSGHHHHHLVSPAAAADTVLHHTLDSSCRLRAGEATTAASIQLPVPSPAEVAGLRMAASPNGSSSTASSQGKKHFFATQATRKTLLFFCRHLNNNPPAEGAPVPPPLPSCPAPAYQLPQAAPAVNIRRGLHQQRQRIRLWRRRRRNRRQGDDHVRLLAAGEAGAAQPEAGGGGQRRRKRVGKRDSSLIWRRDHTAVKNIEVLCRLFVSPVLLSTETIN